MTAAIVIAVVVVVLLVIVVPVVGIYNTLVTLRNRYKNGYSQIDVQLQRRHDLIPNLVETAKGYVARERQTLEAVTQMLSTAMQANKAASASPGEPWAMQGVSGAEGALNGVLSRLMDVVESYPDLKANQNMLTLQEELSSTANKVAFARQAYNDAVMTYNTGRETFPNSVIAGMFNFATAAQFTGDDPSAKAAPKVKY